MKIHPQSLHLRLAIWYAALTVGSMTAVGLFSYGYLSGALASSRQKTMQSRETRLLRFVKEERHMDSSLTFSGMLRQFMLADPDTDILEIESTDGIPIFPPTSSAPTIPWASGDLAAPRFMITTFDGHRYRVLQHEVTMDGRRVRLLMAGRIDSHVAILHTVRNSYLILIPLMVLLSVAGAFVLSHHALRPVDLVTRAAHEISIRNLRRRLAVPDTGDEIQRLAEAWNDVLTRLQSAVEHLTQFTSDISHDMRSTITVMLATAQLALLRPRSREEYRAALKTIEQECEATSTLLDDLLLAARADIAQQNITLAPVDLAAVAEESCDHLMTRAEMKGQRFEVSLESQAWILGDVLLLRRLMCILLDNAVKYTPPQGIIRTSVTMQNESVLLEVRDTGIGIAPQDMNRIFDRFFRADASRNRDEGGSGLGLAIAKWIAEAHHTRISVTSDLHNGSVFSLCFRAYRLPALRATDGGGQPALIGKDSDPAPCFIAQLR
ncbi:MAG TPA: ATP-binding protein [Acidobacteriaceae bacterium]|jgi:heavy metal sensor kinase|nr:ATP-binding protein [Acidobacteriaceae bacterium]